MTQPLNAFYEDFPILPDETGVIVEPLPLIVRSILEADWMAEPNGIDGIVSEIVEGYEQPLPLHELTTVELADLKTAMDGLMQAWGRVSQSSGIRQVPGWLTLAATEYGFICDELTAS